MFLFFFLDVAYNTYEVISNLPQLDSLDAYSINTRHKRDLSTTLSPSPETTITSQQQKNATSSQRTNSRMLGDIGAATTTLSPSTTTQNVTTYRDRPLLGVNGTGQRKDFSSVPPKPVIVSEPINPATINKTIKLNKSAMPTTLPKDQIPSSDDEVNFDNIDELDEKTNQTLINNNLTVFNEDYHTYYNSTMIVDTVTIDKYWKDFKNFTTSNLLSTSYRRAVVSFLFN